MRKFPTALLSLSLVAATPALAIDFTKPVMNEDGKPFTVCLKFAPQPGAQQCADEAPLTLGRMLFDALNQPESGLANDQVVLRGMLALKIKDATNLELEAKERDALKEALFKAVGKLSYKPVAVVQALKVIDPAAVK